MSIRQDSTLSQAQDAPVAPLALDGVDGFYRKGNAVRSGCDTQRRGTVDLSPICGAISVRHENQNMPTFGTAGFRVGGTVYDWAKGSDYGRAARQPGLSQDRQRAVVCSRVGLHGSGARCLHRGDGNDATPEHPIAAPDVLRLG